MRYILLAAALSLGALPVAAITTQNSANCSTSQQVAQRRCYQVAAWTPPSMLYCQQSGQDQIGRPIWLCCP